MTVVVFPGVRSLRAGQGRGWAGSAQLATVAEWGCGLGADIERLLCDPDPAVLDGWEDVAAVAYGLVVAEMMCQEPAHLVCGRGAGELAALAAAGVLTPRTALSLAARRAGARRSGRARLTRVPLYGIHPERITTCLGQSDQLWVRERNGPLESVIAGARKDLAIALRQLASPSLRVGAAVPCRAGFHTPAARETQRDLAVQIEQAALGEAKVAALSSVDGRVHVHPAAWRRQLEHGITAPLRWDLVLAALARTGGRRPSLIVVAGANTGLGSGLRQARPGSPVVHVSGPADLAPFARRCGDGGDGEGERVDTTVRLIISDTTGVCWPAPPIAAGTRMVEGAVVAHVAGQAQHSRFAGTVRGWLALPGERVRTGQPLLWLDADPAAAEDGTYSRDRCS